MIGRYPHDVGYPAIVPTPEGNLLFEWNWPNNPSIDIDLNNLVSFHVFVLGEEDLELDFDLSESAVWDELYGLLRKFSPPPRND